MSRLDTGIGLVLEQLRALGKTENTLVIFTTDHGAQFSRGKTSIYEGGLHIPLIVRCPGISLQGHTRDELVSQIDILPTATDIYGNGCTRQRYYNMIREVQSWNLNRPIVCNEDSQAIGQLQVAYKTQTSWGYYNNMTKQEPPADWGITTGEDTFFAHRMAEGIGIDTDAIDDQYYLQGLEPNWEYRGQRWLRLASLYPETISYVDFYRNGKIYDTAYDEPFSVHFQTNWRQGGIDVRDDDREWKAVIHCGDGQVIEKTVQC